MKTFYFIFLLLGLWSVPASGLTCWTCENARSTEDCLATGREQNCNSNQEVCQTEVRYSIGWGSDPMIRTGCKQELACNNNQLQNSRSAWLPTQCNNGIFNSVCRCCCKGDRCNERNLLCREEEEAGDLRNGNSTGNSEIRILSETTCNQLSEPSNGKFICSNGNFLESTCDLSCDPGFELVGRQSLSCLRSKTGPQWNVIIPTCNKIIPVCDPVVSPKNGRVICSGGGEVGTNCTFYCDVGMKMEGSETTSCVMGSDGPIWNKITPTCSEYVCDPVVAPQNGRAECTSSLRKIGTVCSFYCKDDLRMDGPKETTCVRRGPDAVWDRKTPNCSVQSCDPVKEPLNGRAECSGSGETGTICTFHCDNSSDVIGSTETTCVLTSSGPVWSHATPTCSLKMCTPLDQPANGEFSCAGSGEIGTICTFSCDANFDLNGATETSCVPISSKAEWDQNVPTCSAKICNPVVDPENGRADCEGDGEIGTECAFYCDDGFELEGADGTTCIISSSDEPEWDRRTPTCKERVCDPIVAPEQGRVECTGSGEVGTLCRFHCNDGYDREGPEDSACLLTSVGPVWDTEPPTCVEKCTLPNIPDNSEVDCTGSGEVGTNCAFICSDGFELDGSPEISCVMTDDGPEWNRRPPVCLEPIPRCPELGELPRGEITCTDSNNEIGARCFFQCTQQDYTLVPRNRSDTECVFENGRSTWSRRKPCCNPKCPPAAKKDIVILIDSSNSIKPDEWETVIEFLVKVIGNFTISENDVQIAAFRFNRRVDTTSQILFGDYEDKVELINKIRAIPRDGGGTHIGKALRHARDVVLKNPYNRPNISDMVWVVTDGRSKDEVKEVAEDLRNSGVEILALGIQPDKNKRNFEGHLVEITGDKNLVIEVIDDFSGLDAKLDLVADKICESSCT